MIELPFPHKALWPNGRPHWATKSRENKKHVQWAHDAMKAYLPRCFSHNGERVRLTYTIHPKPRTKSIDKDNAIAAMKAYQDGFAKAMGINDSLFDEPRIIFGQNVPHGRVYVDAGDSGVAL